MLPWGAYPCRLSAARLIQAWWRGHAVRLQTEPILAAARQRRREARAAVVIQRAYRAHLEREAERRRTAALAVLTARVPLFRRWLARVRARHAAADRERAAVVVQSYWRMCQTRRQTRQIIRRITKVQVGPHTLSSPFCLRSMSAYPSICMTKRLE